MVIATIAAIVWTLFAVALLLAVGRGPRRSTTDTLSETVAALDRSEAECRRLRRELALATEQRAAVVDSYRRVKAELEAARERAE